MDRNLAQPSVTAPARPQAVSAPSQGCKSTPKRRLPTEELWLLDSHLPLLLFTPPLQCPLCSKELAPPGPCPPSSGLLFLRCPHTAAGRTPAGATRTDQRQLPGAEGVSLHLTCEFHITDSASWTTCNVIPVLSPCCPAERGGWIIDQSTQVWPSVC